MYLYHYLIKQKVQEAVFAQVPAEQEQVWARHILVPSESEALDVLQRLESGEKWADVAAEVSLDTSNKDNGGDLGWFSAGQMVTEFNDSAFGLDVGEISDPVETQFGWHLIQLVNRAVLPLPSTDLQNKQSQVYQTWLAEAKESIPYQINDVYRDLSPADPSIAQVFATLQAAQTDVPAE
jgi:foldase protein PrsA